MIFSSIAGDEDSIPFDSKMLRLGTAGVKPSSDEWWRSCNSLVWHPSLPPPPHSSPPAPDYPSNVMGAEKFVNPFLSFPSTIKTTAATTATVRRNDIGQWTGVGEPMPIKWIFLCVSKIESKQYDRVSLNWVGGKIRTFTKTQIWNKETTR